MHEMNRKAQLICTWSGPIFAFLFVIGGVLIGKMIPPILDSADPSAEFGRKVTEHLAEVRIGSFIIMMACALMATWGAGMAAQTRPREGNFPVLTYAQLVITSACTALALMTATFWAIMGFRPEEYGANLVQYSADMAYFIVLFSWPIFSLWCAVIALAVLLDDGADPVYPRWVGWANVWFALSYIPGGLILFFKSGPFSWTGMLGLYLPFLAFFGWILFMSIMTLRNIKAGAVDTESAGELLTGRRVRQ
jgi:hypothetical protein